MTDGSMDLVRSLEWKRVKDDPDYNPGDGYWLYETQYAGVRIACGLNDAGPVAWVGNPEKDLWIDSVACDGSFESGARCAVALAWEVVHNDKKRAALGLPSLVEARANIQYGTSSTNSDVVGG